MGDAHRSPAELSYEQTYLFKHDLAVVRLLPDEDGPYWHQALHQVECMARPGGGTQDLNPDWALVCEVACGDELPAEELKKQVAAKSEAIARLPEVAKEKGVPAEVIARAMGRCAELAAAVGRLSDNHDAS